MTGQGRKSEAQPKLVTAYIALGSNLGDCPAMLEKAVKELQSDDALHLGKVSTWYWTQPIGGPSPQPKYLNGVLELSTSLKADELLAKLLSIEKKLGRKRQQRWGPRCIDLDLLLFGQEVIKEKDLELPHPLMHERAFVLRGLAQIAPDVKHPLLGMTAKQMWQKIRPKTQDSKQ